MKKIISLLLILATLFSCFTVTTVSAAGDTTNGQDNEDYMKILKEEYNRVYEDGMSFVEGQKHMKLMARYGGYELYCNPYTGEVAYVNQTTKQVLTTNPYNFSKLLQNATGDPDPTKNDTFSKLLSQIEVSFVDNESKVQTFTSFVEAAARNQIVVKYMKNGIRVEYTMGRLNTAYLLPGVVLEKDFRKNIINPIKDLLDEIEWGELGMESDAYEDAYAALMTLESWYLPINYDDPELDEASRDAYAQKYPIFKPESEGGQGATLYCLDESSDQGMKDTERVRIENLLKTYCPDLDHELLDEMHAKTGYVPDVNETPVFRAALEYVLEDDGLSVRMPASSIRFDETKYTLQYVKILQFFGAGDLNNEGYVFYPDGSGAIVEFREFYSESNREAFTLSGTVYGEDFAYYDIDQNAKHSETIRVPVFGIVESKNNTDCGFFAILEDGDALADIATYFGGGEFNYATAYPMVYPRPSDVYNLAEAISVADNKEMTIVSDKKYTGFYELKYIMLFDENNLAKADVETANRYTASYSGMAAAYRDYLVAKGTMKPFEESSVQNGKLPLYIETLGSIETVKKILSIPVNVDVPLASFENIKTMYTQLEKKNVTNINFKLTGYANGGLNGNYPEKVKWLSAVGGKKGFADLQEFASGKFGIYPEFDFSYASYDGGVSLKKHASRAVDDRYCSKQLYDPVYQQFDSYFDICISPSSIIDLVSKFSKSYSKFEPTGISVSTLGSDLNSDFNKDAPLNRQDAEDYIKDSLALLDEEYQSVMAEGGNIYSVEYLDHILNLPLDASNYKYESKAVPFLGMVLHGYVNYSGTVINEAGDSSFRLLKSIENGALLYYMLIYQNSSLLKEDEELSKYYSVRFDIWFNTIVDQYNLLNGAIGDLQLYNIVEHNFIIGERIPTDTEKDATVVAFDELLSRDLLRQYNNLLVEARREIRVKRIAQELINASVTTQVEIEARLAYIIGEELTDTDKATIAEALSDFQNAVPFEDLYNKQPTVAIDRAKVEEEITKRTGAALTAKQTAILDAFIAEYCTDNPDAYTATIDSLSDEVKMNNNVTSSFAQDGNDYVVTDYTDNSGRIVLVTYAKGEERVHFVLNYNTYEVNIRLDGVNGNEVFVVPSYGFRRINGTVLAD
ncbi:MAG: hypothetical protein E7609_00875 [Ruminococcaceae bacterium]|nr:hypothetical protein [Oscillospiraceae bacterium]